jgi:hypothetical protein
MAAKGAKSPFNICLVSVPTTKTDANGAVSAGDNKDYYFQSSRIYEEKEVGKRCGITLIDPDKWEGQEPLIKVEQLILSRKLVRATGEVDTGKGVKPLSILVARTKIGDVMSDDKAKNLDGLNAKNNKGDSIGKFFNVRSSTRDRFS